MDGLLGERSETSFVNLKGAGLLAHKRPGSDHETPFVTLQNVECTFHYWLERKGKSLDSDTLKP